MVWEENLEPAGIYSYLNWQTSSYYSSTSSCYSWTYLRPRPMLRVELYTIEGLGGVHHALVTVVVFIGEQLLPVRGQGGRGHGVTVVLGREGW